MRNLANYIVHCSIEKIQWDEHNRPYEQTPGGRIMLSMKKGVAINSYNSKN